MLLGVKAFERRGLRRHSDSKFSDPSLFMRLVVSASNSFSMYSSLRFCGSIVFSNTRAIPGSNERVSPSPHYVFKDSIQLSSTKMSTPDATGRGISEFCTSLDSHEL